MRKKILVMLFLFIATLSCEPEKEESTGIVIDLKTLSEASTEYLNFVDSIDADKGVSFDSLGITVRATFNQRFAFAPLIGINSANATSWGKRFDKVSQIIVTSNRDYNIEYPSGVNLLPILSASSSMNSMENLFLAKKMAVTDLLNELDYSIYVLTLTIPPTKEGEYIFTVIINTLDDKMFFAKTKSVFIRKDEKIRWETNQK